MTKNNKDNDLQSLLNYRKGFYKEPFHISECLNIAEDIARNVLVRLFLPESHIEIAIHALKKQGEFGLENYAVSIGLLSQATVDELKKSQLQFDYKYQLLMQVLGKLDLLTQMAAGSKTEKNLIELDRALCQLLQSVVKGSKLSPEWREALLVTIGETYMIQEENK